MIRKYQEQDLDSIMEIWLEGNLSAHPFIDKTYWENNYELVKEMMPSASIYVYEDAHGIEGFIGLMDHYIAGLFVRVNMQFHGIGSQLLNYVKNNHKELTLHVYEKNTTAVQFYEKEQFVITGKQIDEATGEVELTMHH